MRTSYKVIVVVALHILAGVLCADTLPSDLTSAKDYKNISGNQIYLFEEDMAFSYITIDITQTTKLKATIFLYINQSLSSISNGVYTSIGFGTSVMAGADIILCAAKSDSTCWCKDYTGIKENINSKTAITTLTSFKVDVLATTWAPYKTLITFNIERTMTVTDILNGNMFAISAYGALNSSGAPMQHSNSYSFKTGDGANFSNNSGYGIRIKNVLLLLIAIIFI